MHLHLENSKINNCNLNIKTQKNRSTSIDPPHGEYIDARNHVWQLIRDLTMKNIEREERYMAATTNPQPGGGLLPTHDLNVRALFRVFCVSAALYVEGLQGGLYIVGFRSKQSRWSEDGRHRRLEAPKGGAGAAKESSRAGPPLLGLVPSFASFLRP